MLIETSKCGAVLNLDSIILPEDIELETWLLSFPSYGYLLSISPSNWQQVNNKFAKAGIVSNAIGEITSNSQLILKSPIESCIFWDLETESIILNQN